jgi:chaperone BCS1
MTTNHLEKLDPALIRPGRVDLSVLVDDATPSQAKRLFEQFYGETESPEVLFAQAQDLQLLISETRQRGRPLSMATLQGLFIRNTAASAVEACREITRR